jgi:hypothetical protein
VNVDLVFATAPGATHVEQVAHGTLPSRCCNNIAKEANGCSLVVMGIDLEPQEAAALPLGGNKRGTGTGKRVEHHPCGGQNTETSGVQGLPERR